jgi:hypothetical protein
MGRFRIYKEVAVFASVLVSNALFVFILALPADDTRVVCLKAAVLSRASPSPEIAFKAFGIDTDRFEWVCAGQSGDFLSVTYRSLAKDYTVTIECSSKNGKDVRVSKVKVDCR